MLATFGLPMLAARLRWRARSHRRRLWSPAARRPDERTAFTYFKFAFVRNPWDRLVSAFFYLARGGCNAFDQAFRDAHLAHYAGDFTAFVHDLERHMDAPHFRPQCFWVCDATGRVLTDFLGRYETLVGDFTAVAERLDLDAALPFLNASEHRFYREHYDGATCAIVRRLISRTSISSRMNSETDRF